MSTFPPSSFCYTKMTSPAERQKINRSALLQVTPVTNNAASTALEFWLLNVDDGSRFNIYFPCNAVTLRFAFFSEREEEDGEYLLAALFQEQDHAAILSDETRRDAPILNAGRSSMLPNIQHGTLLHAKLPLGTGLLQRLSKRMNAAPAPPHHRSLCLADVMTPTQRDAEMHALRQEVFFRIYDRFDLPLYVDANVLRAHQDTATCVADAARALEAAILPDEDWQEIPRTTFLTFVHTRQARTGLQDIVLTLESGGGRSKEEFRRVEYRSQASAPIVVSYPELLDRVHSETWSAREHGQVPSAEKVQHLLRICVATVRYAHCSLEDVLLQSRLFLATRLVTHECNRLGLMPPSAVENAARAAVKREQRPGEEEEEEYHGGEVFAVVPGVYEGGHLELLDFDTFYLSIMTQFNLFAKHFFRPGRHREEEGQAFGRSFMALIEAKRAMRDPTAKAGIKLEINTIYGVVGREGSPIYSKPLAAETTRLGRENIQRAAAIAHELGVARLFGHTDSILVQAPSAEVCQTICNRVNEGRDIVCLKRSEQFCFVWVQNRTRLIGIRPSALLEGEPDWTAIMDPALQRSRDATLALLIRPEEEEVLPKKSPSVIVQELVDYYETFAKFPGLLASNMPPAYKLALLTFTFTLLALYYKRTHGSDAESLSSFAREVGESIGTVLFHQSDQLQKLAWVHFSASDGHNKAMMQLGPKQSVELKESALAGNAAACDCFWWKRRLNERLKQQVKDTLALGQPQELLNDACRFVDCMLPLGTLEEQAEAAVKRTPSVDPTVVWAEIVSREDQSHNLPNMQALADGGGGEVDTERALAAVRLYAKHTRDVIAEHPLWRDAALDAFAQHMLTGYNMAEYLAAARPGCNAPQLCAVLDKLPGPVRSTLQAICNQASQELCDLLLL